MAFIIFIVILSVLIFVHEVGHLAVAKFFGIRVDEFGLGYPPRAKKLFTWKGTLFTLNWLPFGGFVKIHGEDGEEEVKQEEFELPALGQTSGDSQPTQALPARSSFRDKNRGIQALVLVAGVVMNFLFAWFLISLGFVIGMPSSATGSLPVDNAETTVTSVLPNSPAYQAGLKPGDIILSATRGEQLAGESAREVADFIATGFSPITFDILRGEIEELVIISPELNTGLGKPIIGVSMDEIGIAKLSLPSAVWHGLQTSWELTVYTAQALWQLVGDALHGRADLSGLAGPVGLVGIVGDASILGWAFLVSLTALISINLTLINLLPLPALDGGRLLMVLIESVFRRPIPARFVNAINTAGFALLILLMVVVTIHDIKNIF